MKIMDKPEEKIISKTMCIHCFSNDCDLVEIKEGVIIETVSKCGHCKKTTFQSMINTKNFNFKVLTKEEVEAGRSSAYKYIL